MAAWRRNLSCGRVTAKQLIKPCFVAEILSPILLLVTTKPLPRLLSRQAVRISLKLPHILTPFFFPPQYQHEWTAVPCHREHLVRQTPLRRGGEALLRGSQWPYRSAAAGTAFTPYLKRSCFFCVRLMGSCVPSLLSELKCVCGCTALLSVARRFGQ